MVARRQRGRRSLDARGTVSGVAILASGQVASLESDTESVFAVGKLCVWTPVKGV